MPGALAAAGFGGAAPPTLTGGLNGALPGLAAGLDADSEFVGRGAWPDLDPDDEKDEGFAAGLAPAALTPPPPNLVTLPENAATGFFGAAFDDEAGLLPLPLPPPLAPRPFALDVRVRFAAGASSSESPSRSRLRVSAGTHKREQSARSQNRQSESEH